MKNKIKYNYPSAIESFYEFYEDCMFGDEQSILTFVEHSNCIFEYLQSEYVRIFGSLDFLNEDYISEHIFPQIISRLPEKQQIKINLCSVLRVMKHLLDDLLFHFEVELKEDFYPKDFKSLTNAIHFLVDDFMQLYGNHFSTFHLGDKPIIMMRRMEPFSTFDSVELSSQLLKGRMEYQHYSMSKLMPGAISFIRQTIELILKSAFNIHKITDSKGKQIKISSYVFLEFIKIHQNEIKFPCKFSQLKKVYEWSNYFIHGGHVNYYWVTWEAQFIVYQFFPFKEVFDEEHFIIFDQSLVENINDVLCKFLSEKLFLHEKDILIEFHNKYGGLRTKNSA